MTPDAPSARSRAVRVRLPYHLRTLAGVGSEIALEVPAPATPGRLIDALEAVHPVLRGTIRDPATGRRRPFVRFFACELDLSHDDPDQPLPDAVLAGAEPFCVVGAMAGG